MLAFINPAHNDPFPLSLSKGATMSFDPSAGSRLSPNGISKIVKGRINQPVAVFGLPLILVSLALPALAQVEINQAGAESGNVTTGDTPGFPVTISQPGSYKLTGNLTVPNENTTAIDVTSDDVTIDLSGHRIFGPNVCGGTPARCNRFGSGIGIWALTDGVTVINGEVRGMGNFGIFLQGASVHVENVIVTSNGDGINHQGIGGGTFKGIQAIRNGDEGLRAFGTVTNNVVTGNGGNGISGRGVIKGNQVSFNGGSGIVGSALAIDNAVLNNTREGLDIGDPGGYARNVINNNNGGNARPQVGFEGVDLGQNVCGGDQQCP